MDPVTAKFLQELADGAMDNLGVKKDSKASGESPDYLVQREKIELMMNLIIVLISSPLKHSDAAQVFKEVFFMVQKIEDTQLGRIK